MNYVLELLSNIVFDDISDLSLLGCYISSGAHTIPEELKNLGNNIVINYCVHHYAYTDYIHNYVSS